MIGAAPTSPVALGPVAERVKVTEAVRRTGVPGDVIFLAIRHEEISSERVHVPLTTTGLIRTR